MTAMTNEEWARVQEALVVGGLYECINDIISAHTTRPPVLVNDENRRIIEKAYDDGNGNNIVLEPTDDPAWFVGMYEDSELMLGLEHDGTLYSIVYASGGGLCSVVMGRGLIENDMGVTFLGVREAKAYVRGLTAK